MHRALWICLILAASMPVLAQQSRKKSAAKPKAAAAAPAVQFPIEAIRIEGSNLYQEEKIVAITGLRIGEPGDPKRFEEAKDRLVKSAAFGSVAYRYEPGPSGKGFTVTFEVADLDQVYECRFEQIPAEAEIRAHLKKQFPLFEDRIPGSPAFMETYRKAVEAFLGPRTPEGGIAVKMASDKPGELHVLFYSAKAPRVVAEVHFKGNDVMPGTLLQNTIHGVAVGTEFREERFRELLEMGIRPLYEARGRVQVSFGKIVAEPARGVKGLKVTVEVDEGPSYSLGEVKVTGADRFTVDLEKASNLNEGDVANFEEVRAAQDRIHAVMQRYGFMKVTSKVERHIDERRKLVNLRINVTPGPAFVFGKLIIKGIDIHGEHEVNRHWGKKPGDPFDASYPDHFINRLREENIFENLGEKTRAVLTPNEKTGTVDVTLDFKGGEPQKKAPGERVPF
ncbi:MAG: hypothetical protein JJE04_22395 [Acidobacteriia bacterium]|nr:hypothetical protein [Terriglobia bacterium]